MKLLVLVAVLAVGASARSSVVGLQDGDKPQSTNASCPHAADIQPCVCTVSSEGFLDMDCSRVIDVDKLMRVFQAKFPSEAFRRFTLYQNKYIWTIAKGTFGSVTFEEIWMTEGILGKLQNGALQGSSSTARSLIFNTNKIIYFPFGILSGFTKLRSLDLRVNNLFTFPSITSPTLEVLYLSHNSFPSIPVDAFAGAPSIVDLHLSNIGIKQILPGTFEKLTSLRNLRLGGNQITELSAKAIQCNSNTSLVDLGYNKIQNVDSSAFPGFKGGRLHIQHNFITTLEKKIWKQFVDHSGYLDPSDNLLVCGCDISWLVHNATLLDAVNEYSTCVDGRRLRDLNPADYDHCDQCVV